MCLHPPPSESFSNQLYAGRWFEVGKYQTLGGSIFQIGTVCTEANFIPYGEVGDGDIGYSSRRDTPDGEYVNATGTLRELDAPGHFEQTLEFFGFEGPPTDYNVIYIGTTALSKCLELWTIVSTSCPAHTPCSQRSWPCFRKWCWRWDLTRIIWNTTQDFKMAVGSLENVIFAYLAINM